MNERNVAATSGLEIFTTSTKFNDDLASQVRAGQVGVIDNLSEEKRRGALDIALAELRRTITSEPLEHRSPGIHLFQSPPTTGEDLGKRIENLLELIDTIVDRLPENDKKTSTLVSEFQKDIDVARSMIKDETGGLRCKAPNPPCS